MWAKRRKFQMTAELIAQLTTLFLILGAGPIVVVFLYIRGGNL
jgi:Photosystem II complex subunit Ycf12